MNLRVTFLLLMTMLGMCRADEPGQFPLDPPNPAALARAVNYYVSLGEKRAVHLLYKRIGKDDSTALLCPVLFEPKPGHEVYCPAWGSFEELPTDSMTSAYWRLLPLVLSGKTYFVLSLRRLLTGVPEDPQEYVSSCRANGVFRRTFVPVPTRAEARRDALALRQSRAWQALKWKDHNEYGSYDLSEQQVWEYIKAQADAVK